MDKPITSTASETDVLHFENQSKLSAAEIAKAVAHHNHHHPEKPQPDASPKPKTANKR
jgi:dTDP-4-dehydrorhamnose reductase